MANQKITVEVEVKSNTAKETTQAERLGAALKTAADSAQRIKVPAGAAGASTGVGAVMAKSQPVGAQAVMQYGQQRGTAGVTGAEARDFAAQSQGLGGLVRLYATYAANIYAVGAAFRALSAAMDTTNMVRGLDQLGAQGGVALGSLSKQLVATTGGAISLREAMSATVKVTAAGLGSENVLRLGQVATKASQALGVDMGDAINRLSRGITKLEPELLDELGIFTKIEPAVEKYAISVGKSATQLTDFERRQAFANAVLAEGEKKFAAIKLDANPYNKLAASLTNIAQQGLELLNKVLGPIVDILSSNPIALVAGLATIGTTLIKQAVPAFGLLRQNIQKANEEANAIAASKARDSIKLQENLNKKSLELIEERANKEIQALDAAEKKFKELKEKGVASKKVAKVLQTESVTDISTKQITTIENEAIKARNKGLTDQAKIYDDLAISIRNGKKAEEDYLRVQTDAEKQLQKDINNRRTIIGLNKSLADRAEKISFKNQIVSNAAFSGSMIGPINAIKLMRVEIKASEIALGRFSLAMLVARGSLAAFAGAAATIGAVLNIAFAAITAIVGIGAILVSLFTDTAKESKATGEAIDQLAESTKNLSNTIDVINKKPYLEQFTAESMSARTNALETFSAAIRKANEASSKELQTMNWLDKGVDVVKMIWGGDVQSKLNKEVSYGLAKVFSDAQTSNSAAGKAAKQTIGKLLNIKDTDLLDIDTVNSGLNKLSSTEAAYVISQVNAEVENLAKVSRKSSDPLLGLEESFKKVTEARQKFMSESLAKDSFTEFGRGLITSSFEIESALKNPEARLQAIRRTFEEIKNIGGIPQDLLLGLQDASQTAEKIQVLNASLNNTSSEIDKLTSRKDVLEKTLAGSTRLNYDSATKARKELETITQQIDNLQKSKEIDLKVLVRLDTDLQAYNNTIKEAQIKVFETGSQVVANRLSVEFAKAGATISKAIAGVLPDTEEGIAIRAKSDVVLINAQIAQIRAIDAQITAQLENTLALKERALADKMLQSKLLASTEPDTAAVLGLDISKLDSEVKALRLALKPGGSFKQLSDQRIKETITLGESAVSESILKTAENRSANQAKIQQLSADVVAILEGAKTSTQDAQLKAVAKRLQDEEKSIALDKQRLTSSKELTSDLSEQGVLLRQSIEAKESVLKTQADILEIDLKIKKAERFPKDFPKAKAQFELEKKRLQANQEEEAFNKRLLDAKELITIRSKVASKTESDRFIIETNSYNIQTQILDNKQKFLELQKQQGILTEKDYILQKNSLDTLQASLSYNKEISTARKDQQLALIEQKAAEDRLQKDIEARRQQESAIGRRPQEFTQNELESRKLITDEVNRINTAYTDNTALTTLIYNNTLKQAEAQTKLALEQEAFNTRLTETKSIAESLAGAFGNVGSKIGEAIVGLVEMQRTQELNNKSVDFYTKKLATADKQIQEIEETGDTPSTDLFKQRTEAQENLNKATKKSQKDELTYYTKSVGFAKSLFKEKSGAYKALAAVEKGMHLMRMAEAAKEFAVKTGLISAETAAAITGEVAKTGAAVGGWLARQGTYIVEITAQFVKMLGPLGFAAAAAALAAIGLAGGKKSYSFTPTQAQKVETQGTGQDWITSGTDKNIKNGEKRRVGGGVFGDPTAKADSIKSSLEIIKENSTESLLYDNKALTALEKMVNALDKTATELYRLPGISIGEDEAVTSTERGWTALLGTQSREEILGSTIKLSGSLDDLADRASQNAQRIDKINYENKVRILGIGITTGAGTREERSALPEQVTRELGDVFKYGRDLFKTIGEDVGRNINTSALQVTENLNLKPGMTGEEFAAEFTAITSKQFNIWSRQLFPEYEKFNKFGEEYLETVVRVSTANKSMLESLNSLLPGMQSVTNLTLDASEALVESFGGTQEAIGAFSSYSQSMFTEQERLDKKRTTVGRTLYNLGLQDIKTKAQYNDKVQQLVRDGQTNTDTFKKLILLAPQFAEAVEGVEQRLQDANSAVESAYNDLDSVADVFRNIIKSLTDFKDSLNKTITTPGDQYIKAKARFEQLALEAKTSPKAAQELAGAGQVFAEASRTMFASSQAYVDDVKFINTAVDQVLAVNQNLLTPIEEQLSVAREQVDRLKEISGYTYETESRIRELVNALQTKIPEVAAAKQAAAEPLAPPVKLNIQEKPSNRPTTYSAITSSYAASSDVGKGGSVPSIRLVTPIQGAQSLSPEYASLFTAATGSNYIPKDMPLYVHEGERLMPAADNRELMRMVSSYSGGGNSEMYAEICRLTRQVETLTQVVADGAIMNASATDRNTEQLAATIQNTGDAAVYSAKLQNKVAVV